MPFGEEPFQEKLWPAKERLAEDADREHRLAARRFYRAAPPYCIQPEANGTVSLRQKTYEYYPEREPEEATSYVVISTHDCLDEAERRLRLITGPAIYYDAEGRPTKPPRNTKSRWVMPPTDGE
ncbi:MAG: hypothetical protein AB7F35_29920 [Acetobacteraceae bacterium]